MAKEESYSSAPMETSEDWNHGRISSQMALIVGIVSGCERFRRSGEPGIPSSGFHLVIGSECPGVSTSGMIVTPGAEQVAWRVANSSFVHVSLWRGAIPAIGEPAEGWKRKAEYRIRQSGPDMKFWSHRLSEAWMWNV